MNSLQTYRQNPDRQELFFLLLDCKVHWGILVDWFYYSVYDVSVICRKKESWRFCMLLADQLMVLCVVKKEFRNESTTIWSLPGLLVEA